MPNEVLVVQKRGQNLFVVGRHIVEKMLRIVRSNHTCKQTFCYYITIHLGGSLYISQCYVFTLFDCFCSNIDRYQ